MCLKKREVIGVKWIPFWGEVMYIRIYQISFFFYLYTNFNEIIAKKCCFTVQSQSRLVCEKQK